MDIGRRVRELRTRNGLTLEELASRTELTKGYLSQLERNLSAPSIQTLEDLTEALGTTMSEFFTEDAEEQIVFGAKDAFVDDEEDMSIHWIVPNAQKNQMEPIILYLRPGAQSKRVDPHEGEEFGYVLSGRLLLYRDGDKKGIRVRRGENFCMKGDKAHWLMNDGERDAAVLWISTPPVF
ncbi:MAG: helix-turn-helix domain-containing protein [Erysipelotrichaceae bacterium]|nr:helix-turn-helix domain-containing protein [Erysipelotrichaceae bacterium]